MKRQMIKEMISTALYFLGVVILALLIVKYVVQRTEVDGISMYPTLENGESIMVDKVSYRFRDPERYEIIVLQPFEDQPETFYIKRIIGLPGETLQIGMDGSIFINGEKLYEAYGREVIRPENIGRAIEPVELADDEYFVMGDNRNESGDSRSPYVGNIKRNQIKGRAWLRVWPLKRFGLVNKKDKTLEEKK